MMYMKRKLFLGMFVLLMVFVSMRIAGISEALPYVDIDVNTAYDMIKNGSFPDLVVLDVRTKSEYDSGHIYRAVWIPHTELTARIDELAGHEDDEIIVYCESGTRSLSASQTLDSFNFTRVYNMIGGIAGWINADYPTVIATVHNSDTALNYDTIQAAIDAPQTVNEHTILVDEGIYYEHLTVNKSINFVGENKDTTIIDGTFNGTIFNVRTDNVSINNFTIRYSGCGVCGYGGIYIEGGCQNVAIENNQIISNGFGIEMNQTQKTSVAYNNLTNSNWWGILISESSDISIFKNTIAENAGGINVENSSDIVVSNNLIFDNPYGIWMNNSGNNLMFGNDFSSNFVYGISIIHSHNNSIFHNNFIENALAVASLNSTNSWDNDIEGNYWSNYKGPDMDHDGVGDIRCEIDASNYDRYPLMGMFSSFDASSSTYVDVVSNSTIVSFKYEVSSNSINLVVSNSTLEQSFGFCRVTIPHVLISGTYHIKVNNTEPFYVDYNIADNGTHSWIYFEYEHSELEIVIIPEFPQLSVLLPLMIVMLMAANAYRKRIVKGHL